MKVRLLHRPTSIAFDLQRDLAVESIMKSLGFVVLTSLALLPACSAADEAASAEAAELRSGCQSIRGSFSANLLAPEECEGSPVGFCSSGTLRGSISGGYDFSMSTLTPSPEYDTTPSLNYYTGLSVISTSRGTLVGIDNGINDLAPDTSTSGRVVAMIPIVSGTGRFEGATGYLSIEGLANGAAGTVSGTYGGRLCL
jgi:hypothetical protein